MMPKFRVYDKQLKEVEVTTTEQYIPNCFRTLGVNPKSDREKNDFYATDPKAVELLLQLENFNQNILEPACGQGHISKVLEEHGYIVTSFDLIDRGYGTGDVDFLDYSFFFDGDIITNPPYKLALEFAKKSLEVIREGNKVALFVKLLFLESKSRGDFFKENPPKRVWVSSKRLICAKNAEFDKYDSSAVAYAWVIWEKGYKGETVIDWFNID